VHQSPTHPAGTVLALMFLPCPLQRFLAENGLRLVLRSHEGPDAREGREDMQGMTQGYTLDHDTPAGKLMTVFRWAALRCRRHSCTRALHDGAGSTALQAAQCRWHSTAGAALLAQHCNAQSSMHGRPPWPYPPLLC
jgi:hypothetical protein